MRKATVAATLWTASPAASSSDGPGAAAAHCGDAIALVSGGALPVSPSASAQRSIDGARP